MTKKSWLPIAALGAVFGVFLLSAAVSGGQEPSPPGRLTRVLVDSQNNGKAWSEQGLAWLLEREAVTHLLFMATDPRGGTGGIAYSGMPDRLYIVDSQGRVAYKGGRGPFGYKPSEMEQALIMLLMDAESKSRLGK